MKEKIFYWTEVFLECFMVTSLALFKPSVTIGLIFVLAYPFTGCWDNVDYVKERADETWKGQGFEVTGYMGYEAGTPVIHPDYGGAQVWYFLKKVPDNGIIYEGSLIRWGDEIHSYSVNAIDAIKP